MFHSIISGACRASRIPASAEMSLLHEVNIPTKKATFALGCFWMPDSYFGATKGVIRTRVGFTGGSTGVPTYRNLGDHTEAIELDFDPNEITYKDLLDIFWKIHDPTADRTKQYASIIFYHDAEQKELAEKSMKEKSQQLNRVLTTIVPVQQFYNAEDYHQKYRLQQHSFLMERINLKPKTEDLINSHLAARLNGYVAGYGGVQQFDEEVKKLGLNDKVAAYVKEQIVKNLK